MNRLSDRIKYATQLFEHVHHLYQQNGAVSLTRSAERFTGKRHNIWQNACMGFSSSHTEARYNTSRVI